MYHDEEDVRRSKRKSVRRRSSRESPARVSLSSQVSLDPTIVQAWTSFLPPPSYSLLLQRESESQEDEQEVRGGE